MFGVAIFVLCNGGIQDLLQLFHISLSGEANEWVRGVGEGEDLEKEWVELIERVLKERIQKV